MMLEDHTALLLLRNQRRYSPRRGDTSAYCWGAGIDEVWMEGTGSAIARMCPWMMVTPRGGLGEQPTDSITLNQTKWLTNEHGITHHIPAPVA